VGVLNSEIVTFWYRNYYKSLTLAGGYLRINQGEIKTIPVPIPSSSARRRIVTLVENIMSATASKSQKVSKLEAELEVEVATLYGLSSEDLLIVQQS
jgi:restriction endonuclease S subunit